MTLSATIPVVQTVADGVTATFSYDFRLDQASDLIVYQDDTLAPPSTYSVAGVGNETGGTFTFTAVPPLATLITRTRLTPLGQQTSYREGDAFLEQDHEQSVDALAMQITQVVEASQRVPTLDPTSLAALRGLEFPAPDPLKLLGWNTDGTALTLFDSAILTVTPLPGAGARVEAQVTVAVPTINGATELKATALVPAGALLESVLSSNSVAFGGSNGLTGYTLGTGANAARFGEGVPVTLGATNTGLWRGYAQELAAAALDVVLLAETGAFDATGEAIITAVYNMYVIPTAVP